MKPIFFAFLYFVSDILATAQNPQPTFYQLPRAIDTELGVRMSSDGDTVTAFLSDSTSWTRLEVFDPTTGLRTLLEGTRLVWVIASHWGEQVLVADYGEIDFGLRRIQISTGSNFAVPSYPFPIGITGSMKWLWLGEDGSALALASWLSEGIQKQKLVKLRADLSGYDDVSSPGSVLNNLSLAVISGDQPLLLDQIRTSEVWPRTTRGEVQRILQPEFRAGASGQLYISPNGGWSISSANFSSTNTRPFLGLRRWDLNFGSTSEPETVPMIDSYGRYVLRLESLRVNEDGTCYGGANSENGWPTPMVWLPSGAWLNDRDLSLAYPLEFTPVSVLAISKDRRSLAGNARDIRYIEEYKILWVMRRDSPLNAEPDSTTITAIENGTVSLGSNGKSSFQALSVGSSVSKTLVFQNMGERTIDNLRIELRGSDAASYELKPLLNKTRLVPLEWSSIEVTFLAPNQRGHQAEITVFSDTAAGSTEVCVVRLLGGLSSAPAGFSGSCYVNGEMQFPPVEPGGTTSVELLIKNVSQTAIMYEPSASITGSGFRLVNQPPSTLNPGAETSITLEFTPSGTQNVTGYLYFQSGVLETRSQITLIGRVGPQPYFQVTRPDGQMRYNGGNYNVESMAPGKTYSYNFQIRNLSLMPMTLIGTGLSNKGPLAHGESTNILVSAKPFPSGSWPTQYTTYVHYEKGSSPGLAATISLSATRIMPVTYMPELEVMALDGTAVSGNEVILDFGDRNVGYEATEQTFEIINASTYFYGGLLNLSLPQIGVGQPFSLKLPSSSLSPEESTRVTVRCTPKTVGNFSEQVVIQTNDPLRPAFTITIRGRGLEGGPPVFLSQQDSFFAPHYSHPDSTTPEILSLYNQINGQRPMTLELEPSVGVSSAYESLDVAATKVPAGMYRLKASNSVGTTLSKPFYIATHTRTINGFYKFGGESLEMLSEMKTDGIATFQWRKNWVNLTDDAHMTGTKEANLKLTNLTLADDGYYDCEVSIPKLSGRLVQSVRLSSLKVTEKPTIQVPAELPEAFAGMSYLHGLDIRKEPTSVEITGLPPGLVAVGIGIAGVPLNPSSKSYPINITVSNRAGTAKAKTSLRVLPCPCAGTYEGLVERQRLLDNDLALGGRYNLTVSAGGSYSCTIRCAGGLNLIYTGMLQLGSERLLYLQKERPYKNGTSSNEILTLTFGETGLSGGLNIQNHVWKNRAIYARLILDGHRVISTAAERSRVGNLAGRYTAKMTPQKPVKMDWLQEGGVSQSLGAKIVNIYPTIGDLVVMPGENAPATFSAMGSTSAVAQPGARSGSFTWTDSDGLFHLFGGYAYWSLNLRVNTLATINQSFKADHWAYDPRSCLWSLQGGIVSGSLQPRVTTSGLSTKNFPGARAFGVTWVDQNKDIWIFGGGSILIQYGEIAEIKYNDLWRYVPRLKSWEMVSAGPASSGTLGVATSTSRPPASYGASGWTDADGNLWLLHEAGSVWKFNTTTKMWARMSTYQNNTTTPEHPSSRELCATWQDPLSKDVYLYGGNSPNYTSGVEVDVPLSDLWLWKSSTQTWRRIHDQIGTATAANPAPPAAFGSLAWLGSDGYPRLQTINATEQKIEVWKLLTYMSPRWELESVRMQNFNPESAPSTSPESLISLVPTSKLSLMWQDRDGRAWNYGGTFGDILSSSALYSYGSAVIPEKEGWLSVQVNAGGVATWLGMLGDGTSITGSSTLGLANAADGTRPWVMRFDPGGDYMSVQGILNLDPASAIPNRLTGTVTAIENLRPAALRDRSFRTGWPLHVLKIDGGPYAVPKSPSLILGLTPSSAATATMTFQFADGSHPDVSLPIVVGTKSITAASSSLPSPLTKFSASLNSNTGTYTGSLTFSSPDMIRQNGSIQRTSAFHGVILDSPDLATGILIIPERPTLNPNFVPASLTPIRVGEVRIKRLP